jgi:SOS-response transcriptional repressor LexA
MNNEEIEMKTPRERILEFITNYICLHGYCPSNREICVGAGFKSVASINHHISILLEQGDLETDAQPGTPRALRVPYLTIKKSDQIERVAV